MYFIRPTIITDAMLYGSDVPETDYDEYAAGTTYAAGNTVIVTDSGVHKIYESLQGSNTGHYPPDNLSGESPYWLEVEATNRWRIFDAKVGSQASQSQSMTWILQPGMIDSIALLSLEATTAQIVVSDSSTDLVTKEDPEWSGANGTTPPTGWDKVGTPSDFTIDTDGALKITAATAGDGISRTFSVTPDTEYQLFGIYRNTDGDVAQYAIYDESNSADIAAATDLASRTVNSVFSYVFTTPPGCASITVFLLAKSAGDVVWFDTDSLDETVYNETTDLISNIAVNDWYEYFHEPVTYATELVKSDLASSDIPPFSDAVVIVTVTDSGGTPKCGEIVVGLKREIGTIRYGGNVGIKDYSVKDTDEFGNVTIVERAYSKRMECDVTVKNKMFDELNRLLALYRATPIVYVGIRNCRGNDDN